MAERARSLRRLGAVGLVAALVACSGGGRPSEGGPSTSSERAAPQPAPEEEGATAPPSSPTWSAIHADGSNSDYSPQVGPGAVELAWTYEAGGLITVGPTSDETGHVYLTDNAGPCHLQALDLASGELAWCTDELDLGAAISSALIDRDGDLYVADSTALHSFAPDGTLRWEAPIVGVPLSAQLTPDGDVVLVTNIGQVHVVDRATGRPTVPTRELIPGRGFTLAEGLWPCARGLEGCPSANTIAVHPRTGRIFLTWWEPGAPQASVRALDIRERPAGIVDAWTNDTLPGGSGSSPTISADGERLYVTDNTDSLYALDVDTGEVVWQHRIGWAAGGSPSASPEGLVIPAGAGPLLAVRDLGDRAERAWTRDDLISFGISTQAAGDRAYPTVLREGRENDLLVVDTTDGTILDRDPIPGTTLFSVGTTVAPDGTILVPTFVGTLHAFRPAG